MAGHEGGIGDGPGKAAAGVLTVAGELRRSGAEQTFRLALRRYLTRGSRTVAFSRRELDRVDSNGPADALEAIAAVRLALALVEPTEARRIVGVATVPLATAVSYDGHPDEAALLSITIASPVAFLTRLHWLAWVEWGQAIDFPWTEFRRD